MVYLINKYAGISSDLGKRINIIKDNFDSFKIKYELEGNSLFTDLNKKIVDEIENRFINKIKTNLCSYYKDLWNIKERNKREQDTDRGFIMSIQKLQDNKLDIAVFKDGKNGLKDDIKNDILHELNMKNICNDKCLGLLV